MNNFVDGMMLAHINHMHEYIALSKIIASMSLSELE